MLYSSIILSAAKAAGISGALLLAVCSNESSLTNAMVLHDGGSPTFGVCQIKFDTARSVGYKGEPMGLMNAETNATMAARYLKYQLKRYDGNWCAATASYNSGSYNESTKVPGKPRNLRYVRNVQRYLEKGLQSKLSCDSIPSTEADGSYGRVK